MSCMNIIPACSCAELSFEKMNELSKPKTSAAMLVSFK